MFGSVNEKREDLASRLKLMRLSFPRRVYTQSHFGYLRKVIKVACNFIYPGTLFSHLHLPEGWHRYQTG